MLKDDRNRGVILIGLTIIFTILLSYLPEDTRVFGYQFKPVDLFMDIKPDSLLSQSRYEKNSWEINSSLFAASLNHELIDGLFSSVKSSPASVASSEVVIQGKDVRLSGNVSKMSFFINALKQAKTKKIRIAHLGDSEIEGDLITQSIRQNLQKRFGGKGAGFLSITSQDISFRLSTKQSFSGNWKTSGLVKGYSAYLPIGLNGFTSVPRAGSWVMYEGSNYTQAGVSFKYAKVYYSNAKSSSIKYSFDKGPERTAPLLPGTNLQELTLAAEKDAKSIKLSCTADDQAYFYGVSLESDNGVYIDNFPLRGNSGVSIKDMSSSILNDFERLRDYQLIILQFGLNISMEGKNDLFWYEREMSKVIETLKKTFPETTILLVSVGDKGIKKGSSFVTDPKILKLVETQKRIAETTQIVFWNMFEAMGGANSMASWATASPPLALKDFSHFNFEGAKKVAKLFTAALMNEFK